jgi:hypothetical protein
MGNSFRRMGRRARGERRAELQAESLSRARGGGSMANYAPILVGFSAMGIPEEEIRPRENVFTFNAWRALGRTVKRGEKGVKVVTWITTDGKSVQGENGEEKKPGGKLCRSVAVFHISQTVPLEEAARVAC